MAQKPSFNNKDLFDAALAEEGVTGTLADLARSIYMQESGGGRNTNTSNAGAVGGMQIIPSTFASVADKGWNIADPMHNARAGIRYIGQMFKQAGGDPAIAAAGYYGGPGGLEKARKGIAVADPRNPKAPNTLQYGQQVAARMGKGSPVPSRAQEAAPVENVQLTAVEPVQETTPLPVEPTQLAQVEQAPPVPQEWEQFQQQVPSMQFANMNYGQLPAVQTQAINFNPFKGWRSNKWRAV